MELNKYDLSSRTRTAFDIGMFTPMYLQECIPGGKYKLRPRYKIDVAAFAQKVMGNFQVRITYAFSPFSYLWKDWENYYLNRAAAIFPYIAQDDLPATSEIAYYLPVDAQLVADPGSTPYAYSALPHRMYNDIYINYMKPDFTGIAQTIKPFDDTDDVDTTTNQDIRYDFYEESLFTRMRPQQLVAAVTQSAPFSVQQFRNTLGITKLYEALQNVKLPNPSEFFKKIFGTYRNDTDRSTIIKTFTTRMEINEIISTAATTEAPLGATTGIAYASTETPEFEYTAQEFGLIMGFVSIVPECNFIYGHKKEMYRPSSWTDFYVPQYANVGQVAIQKGRVEFDQVNRQDTIGYRPAYEEYRHGENYISGKVSKAYKAMIPYRQSGILTTQGFSQVQEDEYDYLFALPDEPQIMFQAVHNASDCMLPIPYTSDNLNIFKDL